MIVRIVSKQEVDKVIKENMCETRDEALQKIACEEVIKLGADIKQIEKMKFDAINSDAINLPFLIKKGLNCWGQLLHYENEKRTHKEKFNVAIFEKNELKNLSHKKIKKILEESGHYIKKNN